MDQQDKYCPKCDKVKHISAFSKNKRKKDGLQSECKDCVHTRNVIYYQDHREEITAYQRWFSKQFWEKRTELRHRYTTANREKVAAAARKYHEANREKILEKQRRYHTENRERLLEYNRQRDKTNRARNTARKRKYRAENPEKYKVYTQTRRTRILNLPMNFDEYDWAYCLAYWNNSCAICGRSIDKDNTDYTIAADHWIPLSDPRPDNPGTVPENMLPLCHGSNGCNNSKKNHEPITWLFRYLGNTAERKLSEIMIYFDSVKDPTIQTIS
jgi:hypothetical protein